MKRILIYCSDSHLNKTITAYQHGRTSLFLSPSSHNNDVIYYSVPYGLLTVDILHINNERDIELDTKAGVYTFARFLGRELSYIYHCLLIIVSYGMVAYRGFVDDNFVLFITNLCIPWAVYITKRFKAGLTFELP